MTFKASKYFLELQEVKYNHEMKWLHISLRAQGAYRLWDELSINLF